jgi:hypothetical protein
VRDAVIGSGTAARRLPRARRPRLTPAALALIAWAAVVAALLVFQPVRAIASQQGGDWTSFAMGGRLLHEGFGAALFDPDSQLRVQTALVGGPPPGGLNPYPLFPLFAVLIQPLALLPLSLSTPIWIGLMAACLLASVAVLDDLLPAAWSESRRLLVGFTTVLLLPLVDSLGWAQVTPLLLLLLALAVRHAARHGDSVVVGLLLAGVALKPQLVWLVLPGLLMTRSWRTLGGFAAGAAVWGASTIALVGPAGIGKWIGTLIPDQYVGQTAVGSSLPGMLTALGVPTRAAFAAAVVLACCALGLLWRSRSRLQDDLPLLIAIGVTLSALCSPHAFPRDMALVAVALVLTAARRPATACSAAMVIGAAYLIDFQVTGRWKGDLVGVAVIAALAMVWPRRASERAPALQAAPQS